MVLGLLWEGGNHNGLYEYDDDDDIVRNDDGQGGNSTCAQWTKCAPCLDYFDGDDGEGCLWCNVPKHGGDNGLCVPRSSAQDSCEIGELQATCDEGVGWYVLVLTLAALLCCCCFLTMARKFVAVWHERRWAAAHGDLTRPLLENEDGEEQAHEVVFRGSLTEAGGTSWRCPVCGFDNRPLCKHCDLCGISSEFAEVYWKDKNTPKRKGGRTKRPGTSVEGGSVGWKPLSPTAAFGSFKEESAAERNSESDLLLSQDSADDDHDESGSLLRDAEAFSHPAVPVGLGSIQDDSAGGAPEDESEGRGSPSFGLAEKGLPPGVSEKSRVTTFRLRRPGKLTERQKRARRRRIWQRVIGADGKLRWKQTLDSPATAIAIATVAAAGASSAASLSSAERPPPPSRNPAEPARDGGDATDRSSGASVTAAAAAALRYWASSRFQRRPPRAAARGAPSETRAAAADDEASAEREAPAAEPGLLSDAEKGEGGLSREELRGASYEELGSRDGSSGARGWEGRERGGGDKGSTGTAVLGRAGQRPGIRRRDSFGDEGMMTESFAYYSTFLNGGGLALNQAEDGEQVAQVHPLPPSANRRGAGEGSTSDSRDVAAASGAGTGPSARQTGGGSWADGEARRREARREAAASEEWISSTRADVAKLCDIASRPFWQKHSWFLDQLHLLQVPHGAGMEAMRIEVNRKNLLEDSFAQVSAMNAGELRRWLRVQFVGEPGVDAGGLEREWFLLVCRALFDPSTGLFTPQPSNGAFAVNPSSGVANEMHLEYFRFTGRVLGKLLMEHSVAPFPLSLPVLKHLLGLPVAFSDLEFADPELHRNLCWLRANAGVESLGLDFTITLESFGVKEVVEILPGGKNIALTDDNKEIYLHLRLKQRVLFGIQEQLWNLLRGFYDVVPAHLISVFDYQELELLLCGIPEIDVSEWKRHSRYLGEYRRTGEQHPVIKWFWEVVEAFSEDEKARFLQFCTGTSRLPPHGFKALQSNDGSFRAFALQSVTKRESAFPRAHTCFNKLDLPMYDSKKELEECLGLCICFELTGFTID